MDHRDAPTHNWKVNRDRKLIEIDDTYYDCIPQDWSDERADAAFVLPGKVIVCPRCDGRGSYVNPSIDAHGISPEEFHEDPDFAEDYFRGSYDITCVECNGTNVVLKPNKEAMNADQHLVLDFYFECYYGEIAEANLRASGVQF